MRQLRFPIQARACIARLLLAAVMLVMTSFIGALIAAAAASDLFASLEAPPTPEEVRQHLAAGVRIFEMHVEEPGAAAAIEAARAGGAKVAAYHVGGGGGRAWGSVRTGEFVRKYDEPRALAELSAEVRRLVALGADYVHFDNTHRMSGKRLEAVADAIRAGGAGFVAKNNASKWRLVMKRRPDLVPAYAVVEDAMFDAAETQAAFDLSARGVRVYIVGFGKPIERGGHAVSEEYAAAYKAVNPWATVLLMPDERRYDSRGGKFF